MDFVAPTPAPTLATRCACGHSFAAHDGGGCAASACKCRQFTPAAISRQNDERPA
jgi:hypothetical protein